MWAPDVGRPAAVRRAGVARAGLLADDAMGTTASAATLRAMAAPAFMRRMIKICGIALVAGLVIGLAHFTSWTPSNAVAVAPADERTNAEAADDLRTSFVQAAAPAVREDRAPMLRQAAPATPAETVIPAAPAAPVEAAAPAAPAEAAMPPAAVPAAAITQAVSETVATQSSEPVAAVPSEPVVAAPSATPSDEFARAPAVPKAAAKKPAAHKSASKKSAADKTAQTSAVEAPAFPTVDITTPR
jgi:hypothetical protein